MVTHAIDHGVSAMAAATVLSVAGLASLSGKIVCGLVADRVGAKRVLLSGLALQAIAMSLYLVTRELSQFYAVALMFGFAYGGVMPLYAILVREYFGARNMGTIFGAAGFASTLGMAHRAAWPAAGCTTRPAATPGCSSARPRSASGRWRSRSRSARPARSRPRCRVRAWPTRADSTEGVPMGAKSEVLAKQFEAKAQEAASVLEKLSDADWKKVTEAEKWTVGVTAHHLARAFEAVAGIVTGIVSGQSPGNFTTGHARRDECPGTRQEHANCTKAETIALLKKGVPAAAAVVRGLTDDQLAKSGTVFTDAPPMTAEQLITRRPDHPHRRARRQHPQGGRPLRRPRRGDDTPTCATCC